MRFGGFVIRDDLRYRAGERYQWADRGGADVTSIHVGVIDPTRMCMRIVVRARSTSEAWIRTAAFTERILANAHRLATIRIPTVTNYLPHEAADTPRSLTHSLTHTHS